MRKILFLLTIALVTPALAMQTYGPVKRGESLWKIAVKNRPARTVSIQDTIAAIEKMNPSAFRGRGASSLKVGATLMLPTTAAEVQKALHPEATTTPPAQTAATPPVKTTQPAVAPKPALTAPGVLEQTTVSTSTQNKIPLTVTDGSQPQTTNVAPVTPAQASTQSDSGGIPWSWLWFIICVIGAAYFLWYRKYHESLSKSINKGLAAARLGISGHRREPVVSKYKTRRFKDKDAMSNHFQAVNKTPFPHSSAEALACATIDIAENNFESAENSLRSAILGDKKNVELRMKLLELYVKTNNRVAFKRESDALEHYVSSDSKAWSQVKAMYLNQWAYD